MHRPLFLEGEAGVGKTALAHALAEVTGRPIYRLQCYEGLEASQALYDWDFGRQLLHLRAAEAAHAADDPGALEASLYDRRFLLARPLLQALEDSPSVLLIDEIDRADDEFEAFLLEVLSDFTISIPELGTVRATTPPLVVLTSNRTREVHDALKRRCLYHWLEHPGFDREVAILRRRLPEVTERLAREVARATARLRDPGPAQAARASPRRWTGRRRCTPWAPASSTRTPPPARWARCSSTARTPSGSRRRWARCSPVAETPGDDPRDDGPATSSTPSWGSPARCGRPGWRRRPTASRRCSPRWARWTSSTRATSTGPAG